MSLESAAVVLLNVRRETGCLALLSRPDTPPAQRRLIERYAALVQEAFPPAAAPG